MSRRIYWLPIILVHTAFQSLYAQTDSVGPFQKSQQVSISSNFSSLDVPVDLTTKKYSRQDTSSALQQLFAEKRSSGKIYTMVGGCNLMGGLIGFPAGAPVAVVGLMATGFGLLKKAQFRPRREEVILRDYKAGISLPKRLQRRLKTKYFG